jgi:hypothetical protein
MVERDFYNAEHVMEAESVMSKVAAGPPKPLL